MIVDTSAFAAVALGESNWQELRFAMVSAHCIVPATVLTELQLAMSGRDRPAAEGAEALVEKLLAFGMEVAPFERRHANLTATARERFGKGNGRGGKLNFGDLMVYAIAKERGEPLLCTGSDFASTDLELHPASRLDP